MEVFDAAEKGDLEQVRALVEQDAGLVHTTNDEGWTPLLCAAFSRNVEVARYPLDHNAEVNHHDNSQWTALHSACCNRRTGAVPLLLQRGADVTAGAENGATPLMLAAMFGREAVVRVLLEHGGSDVDARDHIRGTACHGACYGGHADVLRQLLEGAADPTIRTANGRTAGDLAAIHNHQACVTILQEWERVYTLVRVRRIRDATAATPPAAPPAL